MDVKRLKNIIEDVGASAIKTQGICISCSSNCSSGNCYSVCSSGCPVQCSEGCPNGCGVSMSSW